jgi:hypothetical protein
MAAIIVLELNHRWPLIFCLVSLHHSTTVNIRRHSYRLKNSAFEISSTGRQVPHRAKVITEAPEN